MIFACLARADSSKPTVKTLETIGLTSEPWHRTNPVAFESRQLPCSPFVRDSSRVFQGICTRAFEKIVRQAQAEHAEEDRLQHRFHRHIALPVAFRLGEMCL